MMTNLMPLGRQEVDLAVFAKVAAHEASRQPGVARLQGGGLAARLGLDKTPGVETSIDEDGVLHMDIALIVRYDADLRSIGPAVQQAVISAVRRLSDQPVGQVNVYVADIEFPPARPAMPGGPAAEGGASV